MNHIDPTCVLEICLLFTLAMLQQRLQKIRITFNLISSFVVRVGSSLWPSLDDADEPSVVNEPLLGAARQSLLFILFGYFRGLIFHFTSPSQTAVYFAHDLNMRSV